LIRYVLSRFFVDINDARIAARGQAHSRFYVRGEIEVGIARSNVIALTNIMSLLESLGFYD